MDREKILALWKQCLGKPGLMAGQLQGRCVVVLVTRHTSHLGVCACCLLAVDVGLGNGLSQVRAVIDEIKSSLQLLWIKPQVLCEDLFLK